MEEKKQLSGEESLRIIQQMIQSVQHEIHDSSFHYLLWGWLVFIASMLQFVVIKTGFDLPPYVGWMVLMPLGGIVATVYGRKMEKQKRVKTYLDEFLRYVIWAFLISLFIVLFFMGQLREHCYPMIMVVYAIWLFISGSAIRFTPIKIGGIINWALAIVALFFTDLETQSLILAAAVLLGYIIPGHMLKAKYAKQKLEN
ncbi:MAG: hypothetical protein ABI723_01385 [Bacteroidia bacterium]